jgi:hypothetical protein
LTLSRRNRTRRGSWSELASGNREGSDRLPGGNPLQGGTLQQIRDKYSKVCKVPPCKGICNASCGGLWRCCGFLCVNTEGMML